MYLISQSSKSTYMKTTFDISYDIIESGKQRGSYNTSVQAIDKQDAERLFDRYYPAAFLVTCEPAKLPVADVDVNEKEYDGAYADDDLD